jgi:hypothetical protein
MRGTGASNDKLIDISYFVGLINAAKGRRRETGGWRAAHESDRFRQM